MKKKKQQLFLLTDHGNIDDGVSCLCRPEIHPAAVQPFLFLPDGRDVESGVRRGVGIEAGTDAETAGRSLGPNRRISMAPSVITRKKD